MTLADLRAALTQGLSRVVLTAVTALSRKQRGLDLDAHPCEGTAGVVMGKGPFESGKRTAKRDEWVNTVFSLSGIGQATRAVFSSQSAPVTGREAV